MASQACKQVSKQSLWLSCVNAFAPCPNSRQKCKCLHRFIFAPTTNREKHPEEKRRGTEGLRIRDLYNGLSLHRAED
jgi:hemolysin-activating ACP:hemolysin acyltransferase